MKTKFTSFLKQLSNDESPINLFLTGTDVGLNGTLNYTSGADYIMFLNKETNYIGYIPLDKISLITVLI